MGGAGDGQVTDVVSVERPPEPGRWASITWLGVAMAAFWAIVIVAVIYALAIGLDPQRFGTYGWRIVGGFLTTLRLVAISLVVGAVLSVPVAMGRLSASRPIGLLAYGYSYFFRGTPIIAQLFLIYYGAGQFAPQLKAIGLWWFFRDAFNCAVFSFALNTAAYQAEILAGSVRGVDNGQREAAWALGLAPIATLRKVILPQALISALRPYGNEAIIMVKASAIASIVTVLDLMGQTRFVFSKTYDLSFYIWAAVFYLVLVEVMSRIINAIEARITRHIILRHQH
jgi:polar amino acid transport system permease protein